MRPWVRYTERMDLSEDRLSYYLGLIATDGNLPGNPRPRHVALGLQDRDRSTVVCFATSFVEETPHVGSYQPSYVGSQRFFRFRASLPEFRQKCERAGITPAKSKTLRVNFDAVPDALAFLRGALDGDGSVQLGDMPYRSRIRIATASKDFAFQIVEKFGGSLSVNYKKDMWEIQWRGGQAIRLARSLPVLEGSIERKTEIIKEIARQEIRSEK